MKKFRVMGLNNFGPLEIYLGFFKIFEWHVFEKLSYLHEQLNDLNPTHFITLDIGKVTVSLTWNIFP